METRVSYLERTVSELKALVAAQSVDIKYLAQMVDDGRTESKDNHELLRQQLAPLTSDAAKARGVLLVVGLIGTAFGAAVVGLLREWFAR